LKLKRRLIRVPDVLFVSWDRLPGRKSPKEPCPELIADLVVEVLSRGNTRREMQRKRADFFARGPKLFWIVDPRKFTVTAYRNETTFRVLSVQDVLDGEDVLPGFCLSIHAWFEMAGLETD
jgi:Uma2 family endonuclease